MAISSSARVAASAAALLVLAEVFGGGAAARPVAGRPRVIRFAGHEWTVKASGGEPVGPGPNHFSDSRRSVWVDARGRLHLRIARRRGRWWAAEVVSRASFGHGTYRFVLDTPVDALPPSVVLGLFTWDDDPAFAHREIDVELSRWDDPRNAANAQYAVQPYEQPGNLHPFTVPAAAPSTHEFAWRPDAIRFRSLAGLLAEPPPGGDVLREWAWAGAVPPAGAEQARINLWLYQGIPPADGRPVEIVVADFTFVP
jgi:hypothetical protein